MRVARSSSRCFLKSSSLKSCVYFFFRFLFDVGRKTAGKKRKKKTLSTVMREISPSFKSPSPQTPFGLFTSRAMDRYVNKVYGRYTATSQCMEVTLNSGSQLLQHCIDFSSVFISVQCSFIPILMGLTLNSIF